MTIAALCQTTLRPSTSRQTTSSARKRALALLLTLTLGASACGSGSDSEPADATTSTTAADGADEGTETETTETETTEADADEESGAPADDTTKTGGALASGSRVKLGASVLAKTLDPANQATSGRFTGTLDMQGTGDDGAPITMSMTFEGAYDVATKASSMSMDLSGMAGLMGADPSTAGMGDLMGEPMQMIVIGETGWMKWGLFSMMGVTADQWVEMDSTEISGMTEGFGAGSATDPTEFLRQLEDANADIEELGTETVRGIETTHYRAVVDLAELQAALPADQAADLEATMGAGLDTLPMEFWIGDDGLVYRWSTTMDMSGMADAAGIGSVAMTYEMFDYGQDVGIVAPDPSLVVSGDSLGF